MSGSRIAGVEACLADKYLWARVHTQDGRVGVGEAGAWGHIEATAAAVTKFSTYLVGEDSRRIEWHWEVLQRFGGFSGCVEMAAISAIDVALWDLQGQRLGEPVYALLGGAYRSDVRTYGQVRGDTPDSVVASCRALCDAGFDAVGHLNPFLDRAPSHHRQVSWSQRMKLALDLLHRVRAELGDDCDVCVEIHRGLTPAQAIPLLSEMATLRPFFVEDPIRPDVMAAMAEVQHAVAVPIATGERFWALDQFLALLKAGGARYVRPSLGLCGGFTGARRIAALARAFDIQIVPHNTYSPVATMAAVHFALATSNVPLMEFPTQAYTDQQTVAGVTHIGAELTTTVPVPLNGRLSIDGKPGLGVALIERVSDLHPYRPVVLSDDGLIE
jgi:galactonate dehydratase